MNQRYKLNEKSYKSETWDETVSVWEAESLWRYWRSIQACHRSSERREGYYWQLKKQVEVTEKLQDNQNKTVKGIEFDSGTETGQKLPS